MDWSEVGSKLLEQATTAVTDHSTGAATLPAMTRLQELLHARSNGDLGSVSSGALQPLLAKLDTNHDGKIDLNDITDPGAKAALAHYDRNGDGEIDVADMDDVLTQWGDTNGDGEIDMDDLPPATRDAIRKGLADATAEVSGEGADMREIQEALQKTEAGRKVLAALDLNHDDTVSKQEYSMAYLALRELRHAKLKADGTVDFDGVPPLVSEPLIEALDTDKDGKLTQADLDGFLESLDMDATDHGIVAALDTNGDGLIDIDDVPTEMAAAILDKMDTSGDGRISIEDLPEGATDRILGTLDRNHDGRVTKEDVPPQLGEAVLAALDTNRDGKVDLRDVEAKIPDMPQALKTELDQNGDGTVDLDDLPESAGRDVVTALIANGGGAVRISDLPHATGAALLDANRDGFVSYEDLPPRLLAAFAAIKTASTADLTDPAWRPSIAVSDVPTSAIDAFLKGVQTSYPPPPPPPAVGWDDGHVDDLPPVMIPGDGGGGGSSFMLWLLILLALIAGGGCYWRKKRRDKAPHSAQHRSALFGSSSANFPAELQAPLPGSSVVMSPLYGANVPHATTVQIDPARPSAS